MIAFMGIALAVILVLGFPLFMMLGFTSLLTSAIFFPNLNITIMMQQMINGISTFVLSAIPMFIFCLLYTSPSPRD